MKRRVRITPRAQRDIVEIRSYIREHDRGAAERLRGRIVRAIDLLAEQPFIGRPADEPGIRIKLVSPYPCRIYYRVEPRSISILHVRHTSRQDPEPGDL